jgi:SAM-dependent methyltransferase
MNILYILLLIILLSLYFQNKNYVEGFETFDNIYAKIYDVVFDEKKLYENDVKHIIKNTFKNNNINILDAGCGVGRHYQYLNNKYPIVGVDISSEFLKYARIRNPNGKFINKNLANDIFKPEQFSHILCLLDSIYHNEINNEMNKILSNFYYWLKPDGYLCIHLFDRSKLDPGPREFTQYYKDNNGYKHGLTYFNKFTHDAYWIIVDDFKVKYIENVILEDGRKKKQETLLYIPKDKITMISKINNYGFKLENIVGIENENYMELYIFRKIKYKNKNIDEN